MLALGVGDRRFKSYHPELLNFMADLEILFFFFFSSIAISSSILIIRSKNPIHSILFLILVFCNLTGLLLTSGIEFLSILLIIIYVGAIAVLFLFVIMMLDIQIFQKNINENFGYLPISLLISFIFFIEILYILNQIFLPYNFFLNKNFYYLFSYNQWINSIDFIQNTETLGQILYTYYFFFFLLSGLILLIPLIGAVVLTLKKKKKNII